MAPHHAGLVPAFKETVEHLFAAGLVKLVFATETLSLGINMPARAVVLESLTKFGGEGHELLQPGDYTQLTGRAGRRGIDPLGTAVVLHSPYLPFERVAAIAATGSHPLRSSFRPTYNMAANLVAAYPRERAEKLLNASFAQFHDDRGDAGLAAAIEEEEQALAADREAAACERGDIWVLAAEAPRVRDDVMCQFAASTAAGDVLEWSGAGGRERRVVVARGHGKRPRLLTVGEDGALQRLEPEQLPPTAAVAGRLALPEPYQPRQPGYRREVADLLADWQADGAARPAYALAAGEPVGVAACPDLGSTSPWRGPPTVASAGWRAWRRRRRVAGAGMVPAFAPSSTCCGAGGTPGTGA